MGGGGSAERDLEKPGSGKRPSFKLDGLEGEGHLCFSSTFRSERAQRAEAGRL